MPFDPSSLTSKVLWLRAKDLAGADASAVTAWADYSGLGNSATASGCTLRTAVTPSSGKVVRLASGAINLPNLGLTAATLHASASGWYGGYPPENAVNGNRTDSGWIAATGSDPQWYQVRPAASTTATSYTIYPSSNAGTTRAPTAFTFKGSSDGGASWVTLDTRSGVTWPTSAAQTFSFSNATAYGLYRLTITAHGGAETGFAELELNGVVNTIGAAGDGEMWIVVKSNTTSGTAWRFGSSAVSNHYTWSGSVYDDFGATTRPSFTPAVSVSSQFRLYRAWVSGTTQRLGIDNTTSLTTTVTKGWSSSPALAVAWTGDIAEVLIRSTVSTAAEVADLVTYFNTEHGLAVPGGSVVDTIVPPPAGALALTGPAATVSTGVGSMIAAAAGALALAATAPIVLAGVAATVSPPAAALTLTAAAPAWSSIASLDVSPSAGVLTIGGTPPAMSVASVISVTSGSLSLTGTSPVMSTAGDLTVAIPAGVLTIGGTPPVVAGTPKIDAWTRDRSGLDLVEIEDVLVVGESRPPIAPLPPLNLVRPIMRRSHLVEPGDFTSDPITGKPRSRGLHDIITEPVGYEHVFVGGVDVTYWRGMPVRVDRLTESNLWADDTGQITFPQITPFDVPGVGDLSWLTPQASVDVAIVDMDGIRLEPDVWNGHLVSQGLSTSGAPTWDMVGALRQAGDQMHQVPMLMPPTDIGTVVARELNGVENRSYADIPAAITGIQTRIKGSIDDKRDAYLLGVLAQAWTDDARQWGLVKTGARRYGLALRDATSVHWTVCSGTQGIAVDLSRDQTQRVDRVFGRGISPGSGLPWCNRVFPDVLPYDPPDYPFSNPSLVIELGTTDAATSTGTGVTVARQRLRELGFQPASSGAFNSTDRSATLAFQRHAGAQADGEIGPQTWNALFLSAPDVSDASSFRRPMAVAPTCEQYLYGVNGAITGENPLWDSTVRTSDISVDFGVCTKADGFRLAKIRLERDRDPGWIGRITLRTDPKEGSKEFIRAGHNILVQAWQGEDVLVHVTHVDRDRAAGTVTCTVDSKFRDALTVEQILERNRESAADPARRPGRVNEATTTVQNRLNPFEDDSPAGQVPRIAVNGDSGLWSVWRVYISESGQIDRIRLDATTPATLFSFGLFGAEITPNQLAMEVGDPLADADAWTRTLARLKQRYGYINSAGNASQACGTWPHNDGATVTGSFQDDQAGIVFSSSRGGWVWLALYANASCFIEGSIIPKANQ